MAYTLGLLLMVGLIFSFMAGHVFNIDSIGSVLESLTSKISNSIFPKSEKEITIDNLSNNNNILDNFFSNSALSILNSKNTSTQDKEAIKTAIQAFNQSRKLLDNLKILEKRDGSLIKTTIKKALNLEPSVNPEPTYIPSQCHLVCPEK